MTVKTKALPKPGETVLVLTTNEEGEAASDSYALPFGTYTLQEINPPSGYLLNSSWNKTVEIHEDGVISDVSGLDGCVPDTVIKGSIAIQKRDLEASPAGQERRFSSKLVGEVLRGFTLQLWNTYSFFVTYANLDNWDPKNAGEPEYSDMDRWLLSALNALVRDITKAYENYDVNAATRPIQNFVNILSNWYLRRSRRRFWKSEGDSDKNAAYATLYQALVTVAKLIAPAMPFIADEIYRNLVVSVDPSAPESVHMADWPKYDESMIDEQLNHEMDLIIDLASLGHSARNKANRKVRQPLAEAAFFVGQADDRPLIAKYADVLEEELNVKQVRLLDAAGEAMDFQLNPLPKQLGQKYGKLFPQLRAEILKQDAMTVGRKLLAGENIDVELNGTVYSIQPDEVEVRANAHSGYTVATEAANIAALVTSSATFRTCARPPVLRSPTASMFFIRQILCLRKPYATMRTTLPAKRSPSPWRKELFRKTGHR